MTTDTATEQASVLLLGSDFADDPLTAASGDGLVVRHAGEATAIAETLERAEPMAVVIRARYLGFKDWLAIYNLRGRAPRTLLVLVTTARMSDNTLDPKGSRNTVLLPWPSTAEDVRRALRGLG